MSLLALRLLVAVVFIIVETVFFVALHTYFSGPVDRIRKWFIHQNKRTVSILLPVLFFTNFGVTFLFSGLITPAPAPHIPSREASGVTRTFSVALQEPTPETTLPASSQPSAPNAMNVGASSGLGTVEEPIPGIPADNTLE